MKKVIFIHGMSAPLDECFGKKAKERFRKHGFEIIEPIFPLEKEITLEKWNEVIDKAVDTIDEDTSFLCHSLGCTFVIKYLYRKKARANTVIAVAGGYFDKTQVWPEYPKIKKFVPNKKELEYFRKNTKRIYHIHSDNDDIFNEKHFKDYIDKTGAKEILLKNCGHFGRSSGVKDIKELETILNNIDED